MDKKLFMYLFNFTKNENIKDMLIVIIRLTHFIYIFAFLCMEIWLFICGKKKEALLISLICLFDLLLITVLRKAVNAKRPCEVLKITPIYHHKTGDSFPSRHTSSIWIISIMAYYVNMELGICLIIFAVISGISRIMAGIHFPKDILAGALISIVIGVGFCGFFI